jgi:hypothetical protein
MFAYPQSNILTPFLLLELVFGVVIGMKLEILFHLLLGMYGMYLISSKLYKFTHISSLIPSVVYMMSGMYAFNLAAGQTNFMSIAFVPFVYYFFVKGMDDIRHAIISGYFFAIMIFEGGTYTVPHTGLFIVILSLILAIQNKSLKPLRAAIVSGITGCLLSAIKLLPFLELFRMAPRYIESTEAMTFELLYRTLLYRVQYLSLQGFPGQAWGWEEYAHYVGFLPLILGLIGIFIAYKKKWEWPLIITGIFFLVLAWGNFSDFSPWNILHQLPLFKSQRVPSRFMQYFIFMLSIVVGFSVTKMEAYSFRIFPNTRFSNVFAVLMLLAITMDLMGVNSSVFAVAFPYKPPIIQKNEYFRQVIGDPNGLYKGFLENLGTLNSYEPVRLPTAAKPINDSEYKKGEVYLIGDGTAILKKWTPNSVTVDVKGEGFLLMNQNYATGWHTNNNKQVIPFHGLLATRIDRNDTEITFRYLPLTFSIGAIVSFTTLIISLLLLFRQELVGGLWTPG